MRAARMLPEREVVLPKHRPPGRRVATTSPPLLLPYAMRVMRGNYNKRNNWDTMQNRLPTPDSPLDARTAVEQLQLLVRAVRQRLVRLAQVERDGRLGARRHERVEDDQVVQLPSPPAALSVQ